MHKDVYVCFDCRLTRKGFGYCPKCQRAMQGMPQRFRTGKKDDDKYWEESERLFKMVR